MKTCSIEGCERKHYGRGLCNTHYKRMLRGGDLEAPIQPWRARPDFCSVPDCMREVRARGVCWAHYQRRYHGVRATGPIRAVKARKIDDDALIENVAELIEVGTWPPDIARRVGYDKPDSLAKKLRRLGHPELAQPFWSAA